MLALLFITPLVVAAGPVDEPDRLALAGLLIEDGHAARASAVLAQIDLSAEGLDRGKYWLLRGLAESEQQLWSMAAQSLSRAAGVSPPEPRHLLLWSRAHYQAEEYSAALEPLGRGGAGLDSLLDTHLLRTACFLRLKNTPEAWRAVVRGLGYFPRSIELIRQQVVLLSELRLFEAAGEAIALLLAHEASTAEDALVAAEAVRSGGEPDRAAEILEQARLRFGPSRSLDTQLARAHLEAGRVLAAATIVGRAAQTIDRDLAIDAAELHRRAGRLQLALSFNASVGDQAAKTRQRLALLVELERFEEAAALAPRLSRLGLLADDTLLYALAYSELRTGDHAAAEALLGKIRGPELFEKVAELKRVIDRCGAAEWSCD